MKEHDIQVQFCKYLDLKKVLYFATSSGVFLKDKASAVKIISKMKKAGFKKGLPDVMILQPNRQNHGLMIELKTLKGSVTPEQKVWIEKLNKQGYKAVVCKGLESAIKTLEDYLKG